MRSRGWEDRPRTRPAAALLAALLLAACAAPGPREADTGPLYFPAPPELPRFVHAATLRSNRSVEPETEEERLRRRLGGAADPVVTMVKPYDVAAHGGRVYVTDTLAARVHVFDAARRRYFQFGYRLEGKLAKPLGIAVDGRGFVYVVDGRQRRVVVYDGLGLYVRALKSDELVRPSGVAVNADGSRIYVVDTGGIDSDHHGVAVFDAEGRLLRFIGGRGREPGRFNLPVDAAVGPGGALHVLDAGNFRVQVLDPEGRFLRAFGEVGDGPGQLARPRGIAVDDEGLIYVSDGSFANVQVFDPEGRLLLPLGRKAVEDGRARLALPSGLAVDEKRFLYIVDQYFAKVEVLRRLTEAEGRAAAAASN
ncbi:6-bladed beta-propeller [Inmirania thermothiophila]|uniref:NHL repeat-containing protein n=1 Tax=Inmirania thermothiophila TaxID=1750597 RepID=A0A3N1YA85_9GAMM|nr:6-bladed beta-propeller [Inmirania thermothiophila]ROR34307.1 NHL repeat-containing protein [Inmirania thermothiophila]